MSKQNNNQVVGNAGLYYVCYKLSLLGWNVMPTARNARGIDVLIYSQDAKQKKAIQVKALSKRSPVPLGTKLDNLFGDFFIVCQKVADEKPRCFVLIPSEIEPLVHEGKSKKSGKISLWLQPKYYEKPEFEGEAGWKRIGSGFLN